MVQDKHIKAMLRLSGSSGIYLVPKWPDRARDDRFRVIPVVGACIEDPARLRLEIKHHMGLARLEKRHWGLGYICTGDYTTQLCGDYSKPMWGSLLTNQYFMDSRCLFFSRLNFWSSLPNHLDSSSVRSCFCENLQSHEWNKHPAGLRWLTSMCNQRFWLYSFCNDTDVDCAIVLYPL